MYEEKKTEDFSELKDVSLDNLKNQLDTVQQNLKCQI